MAKRSAAIAKQKEADSLGAIARTLRVHVVTLLAFAAVMWAEEIVDLFLGGALDALGIRPRSALGLVGIPLAPFLHVGFGHLIANTVPFLVLGWLVLVRETWHFWAVTIGVTLLGGLGVWLVGAPNSVHLGASGLVFGFLGYLMLGGFFERRVGTIIGSIVVTFVFGGLLWGVLPGMPGVSWESHLFGFLAGAVMARALAVRPAAR